MGAFLAFLFGQTLALSAQPMAKTFDSARAASFFESVGMTCSDYSVRRGITCKGMLPREIYPEPVALVIPPRFRPRESIEVILHLHGWVDPEETLDDVFHKFRFEENFAATLRNSIFIVPHSVLHCDTFKERLAPQKSFRAFMSHVMTLLQQAGLTGQTHPQRLVLTGHSGAYSTIGPILHHEPHFLIREVYLFDTIYDEADDFVSFAKLGPPYKLFSVFLPLKDKRGQWKWTAKGNFFLWSKLNPGANPDDFIPSALPPDTSHRTIRAQLAETGLVFMRSDTDHDDTVRKYYARALRRN